MTKIALFLPELAGGGAERVMLTLARGFAKEGLSVDLVLARAAGPYLSHVPRGVRLINLSERLALPTLPGLAVTAFTGLTRYLRHEKPASLLSSLTRTNLIALLSRKAAAVQTRLVLRQPNVSQNVSSVLTASLMRYFYPWADQIIAISQGVADDLIKHVGLTSKQVRVIYNFFDLDRIQQLANEDPDHPWFAAVGMPVILSAGRLTPQKDFTTLVRAFAQLRHRRPARLIILGEGKERRTLTAEAQVLGIADDVSLPGFVDNPYSYMARASAFVLSSRWEGFGNVLVEALACGTPVISTDCPSGPSEILDYGKYGPLVPKGNASALAEAILATLDNPPNPQTLRARAKAFSLDKGFSQYFDVLLGLQHQSRQQ